MQDATESEQSSSSRIHTLRASAAALNLPSLDSLAGFESTRYLGKWLLIAGLIGIVAGLGAVVFTHAIQIATDFFLGRLVGYTPPKPIGEGNFLVDEAIERPWLLPFVTALGGLLSGIIVFRFAPSAEGHGTDAAIDAILHRDGYIDPKVPPVKLVASAITIGSGGSAGREGPAAQISAGFASLLSGILRLSPNDRRIAASAGVGSGIGSIFRAPLGGALMSAEILYLHDLEVEALIPGLIASIVGYSIYGAIEGWEPIFGQQSGVAFTIRPP
jgi:CIC family chloride channel protein